MKKIFVAIMAMAAFAACSTNEVISASQGDAIEFSNAFVGNSVRSIDPSITTNTLDNFLVYGTVTNTSNVTANKVASNRAATFFNVFMFLLLFIPKK